MAKRRGTTGDDVLFGTDGDDVIRGLAGDDVIDPRFGADRVDGGAGDDRVVFSSVIVSNPTPSKQGVIEGGTGIDTIDLRSISPASIGGTSDQLTVSVGSQVFAISGIESILLGDGPNAADLPLFYTGPTVEVNTGGGADYLQGSGNLRLFAGDGDDTFFMSGVFGDTTEGVIDGGEGFDTLGLNLLFSVDLAAGTARSGDASYSVAGIEAVSAFADSVVLGDNAANILFVRDLFDYDFQGVRFEGRGGNDVLSGSQGRDTIDGGRGADFIRGSGNVDLLIGGDGADVFAFDSDDSAAELPDTIADFRQGTDRIDLSAIDADSATPQHDRLQFIGQRAFDGHAGELRFERQGHDTIVQIDLDGDHRADQAIVLTGRVMLKPASFILSSESTSAGVTPDMTYLRHETIAPMYGLHTDLP